MDWEIFFLVASGLFFLLDLTLLSTSKLVGNLKSKVALALAFFGFFIILLSYMMLLRASVGNDFSVAGVYSYSSSNASFFSKLYTSWAGAGGSMLFLTLILSIVYIALRITAFRKPDRFNVSACQVFSFVLLVFILVCVFMNPFERFSSTPVEGQGLNPQLQSVWMAIHPPIVFSAYAFVVLSYVLVLACVKTGRDIESSKLFMISTYMGWILLTLGIALGGVWAYEVLGWGGYWAWDPVETASLLPWLLLTGYFVVRLISKSKTSLTREFMIMLAFSSLVFLSALTRGGFTQSVHSYAVSAVGPLMLVFALGMMGYFFYLKKTRKLPLFRLDVDKSSLTARSYSAGFWALILIGAVCLIGLGFSNFAYSLWTFPFVLVFTVSLIGFSLNEKTHYARVIIIVLVFLGVGAGVSLLRFSNVNFLTSFTVPLLVAAFFLILLRVLKAAQQKSLRMFGQALLYLGIIFLLLGVFISAGAKTSVTTENVKLNTQFEAMQLNLELSNLRVSNSSSEVYNEKVATVIPEYSTVEANIMVEASGKAYEGTLAAQFYPNYGLVLKPLIITTATGDIYLHFEYSDSLYNTLVNVYRGNSTLPEEVSVTVQYSPMIYMVWGGVALMLVGMGVQFAGDLKPLKPVGKEAC